MTYIYQQTQIMKNYQDLSPPFQVRSAGHIHYGRYHSTPGTKQTDIMLTIFLDGKGYYQNSSVKSVIRKNMAGLVPPDDPGVLMADPNDPYFHYYTRFNGRYAFKLAYECIQTHGSYFFTISNAQDIAHYIHQIGRIQRKVLPTTMGGAEALLVQALVALTQGSLEDSRFELNESTLTHYLRENIAQPTNLSRIADHFCVSRSTLCRTAKRFYGKTILQIHENMKVEWAKTLLALGRFSIADVALRVGYEDPFYFSRVFKQHCGISPKKWVLRRNSLDQEK